jgi:hypothetical protein
LCSLVIFILYPTDEKRIIKIIKSVEEAAISKDIDKFMGYISYNYSDDYHNGYIQIKEIIRTGFNRLDDMEIERNIDKISVNENLAEAELSVRVITSIGEERGYIIGDAVNGEKVRVFLEKSTQRWFIKKVDGVFNEKTYY